MIVLATPTRESVTAGFAGDLVKLCRRHPDARWLANLGIYVATLRQSAVHAARQIGASHILFLDSDMRFPADTLERLLAHQQPIVGANYVMRTMPEWWTALVEGRHVSSVGRRGLQPVDHLGFGVTLIDLAVFDAVELPWFDTPFDGTTHCGEDVYFCRKATAAGFDIWIDHDLSQAVAHSGTIEYGVSSCAAAVA